eukprot:1152708-Pelagomonas_calceolata.AAC.2
MSIPSPLSFTSQVNIKCRRLGGGFGGKASHASKVASAAAVAAVASKSPVSAANASMAMHVHACTNQEHCSLGCSVGPYNYKCTEALLTRVRVAVDRNTDLAIFGGRCEVLVRYDVGFDDEGHILAVDMVCITMVSGGVSQQPTALNLQEGLAGSAPLQAFVQQCDWMRGLRCGIGSVLGSMCVNKDTHTYTHMHTRTHAHSHMQGGYYSSFSHFDAFGMSSVADNVYAIPAFRAQYQHARCNLPPRTTVSVYDFYDAMPCPSGYILKLEQHIKDADWNNVAEMSTAPAR